MLSLWWSNHHELHRERGQRRQFLHHALTGSLEHGRATRRHDSGALKPCRCERYTEMPWIPLAPSSVNFGWRHGRVRRDSVDVTVWENVGLLPVDVHVRFEHCVAALPAWSPVSFVFPIIFLHRTVSSHNTVTVRVLSDGAEKEAPYTHVSYDCTGSQILKRTAPGIHQMPGANQGALMPSRRPKDQIHLDQGALEGLLFALIARTVQCEGTLHSSSAHLLFSEEVFHAEDRGPQRVSGETRGGSNHLQTPGVHTAGPPSSSSSQRAVWRESTAANH